MDTIKKNISIAKMNPQEDLLDTSANSYLTRASFRQSAGQYEGAISDYKKALLLDSRLGNAHFFMGICYKEIGKKEAAISAFTTAASVYESKNSRQAGAAYRWIEMLRSDS